MSHLKDKGINTKKRGLARIFIYPSKDKYIAVCLDFNIIEEARTLKEVKDQIMEAIVGYVVNVCKNELDDKLLNRNAPEKYWRMYKEYSKFISAKEEIKVKVSPNIRDSSFFSMPLKDLLKIREEVCI